jgi:RHS repeat-associated protein
MKAVNRLIAIDDQVAGQNDLGDYHDNGLYYSQHQTAEFAYDDNGNLEQDMNRNIGIKYGILHNLPIYIAYRQTGGGGSIATLDVSSSTVDLSDRAASTSYSGTMMNYYTLQGRKLGKKVYNDQHTLTLNESYYDELMLSHRQPARISHADGYVSLDENGEATFYYYLTDHLGNVRSVITPDADGKPQVEQANDYFPFGMSFESKLPLLTKSGSGSNKHKYNGKEEQEMPGKWLDYGARFYDAGLGRWHGVDPASEIKYDWTPYRYAFNNPIRYLDTDGQFELDNAQQYSRFTQYLQNSISGILSNSRMMQAIMGYGDLSYKQIADDMIWGNGPKIIVVENLTSNGLRADGKYNPKTPNVIFIDKELVMQLENASSADIDATLLRLISTLLHEYVHFGDWTVDNDKKSYEAGYAFEEWVYGRRIGNLQDAMEVIEEFKKRHKSQEQTEEDKEKNKKAMEDAKSLPAGKYKWDGKGWVQTD